MESKKYVYVVVSHPLNLESDVIAVFESKKDAEDYCDRAKKEYKPVSFTYHKVEFNKK